MSACHPYEPGFAACVGVETPRPWNPYGPTRDGEPRPAAPAPTVLAEVLPVVPATPDDELRVDRTATSVPEPQAVLLTVIALATLWRARRTAR